MRKVLTHTPKLLALGVVSALMGILIASTMLMQAHAGTLPDISGTWFPNGDRFKRCQIQQAGTSVTLINESGQTATGTFVNPSEIKTTWSGSVFPITGRISSDLRTITWSNGTYWSRDRSGSTPVETPRPTPTPNPYRTIHFAPASAEAQRGPIEVFNGWAAVRRDGTYAVVCISFKNTGNAVAKRIAFEFPLSNNGGEVLETITLDRQGTFSPNIEIHGWHSLSDWQSGMGHGGYKDNCSGIRGDNEQTRVQLVHTHYASYRVQSVEFADGTTWP
jgi:hypothetical protein